MNVVMVGQFWFPRGSANASRVRNLALGLRRHGAGVHVITIVPRPARNGDRAGGDGEYEGISYECVAPFTAAVCGWRDADRTVPRLRRRLRDKARWFAGLYAATPVARRRLRDRIARRQCDLVFVYDRSALRTAPLARLCRQSRVPSVLDVTESSEQSGHWMAPIRWDYAAGARLGPRLFDGLTVITTGLESLYRERGCARTLVLPAVEEFPPASPPPPTGHAEFRLTYVGALTPRDAPESLLEIVRLAAARAPAVRLDVVGQYEGTERGRRFVERCATDPVLSRLVRCLGTVSDAALAERLAASDGLLLTRRDASTEALSFPTRLAEYLRCGRPVFVSAVGDVPRYLRDRHEAVLLDPRDPGRAAAAIAEVASSADRGAAIGRGGREAGARAFDRDVHAARLMEFAAGLGAGGSR